MVYIFLSFLQESVSSQLKEAQRRTSELEIALAKEKSELAEAVAVIHILEEEKTASDEAKTIAELWVRISSQLHANL